MAIARDYVPPSNDHKPFDDVGTVAAGPIGPPCPAQNFPEQGDFPDFEVEE